MRWVLWQKTESEDRYSLRKGRYATKTAAEDAMKTLTSPGIRMLALPENVEPQANLKFKP